MRRLALLDDSVIMPSRATNASKMMADQKNESLSPPRRELRGDSKRASPSQQRHREEYSQKLSRSGRNDSDEEKEEPGFEYHNLAKRAAIVSKF